MSEKKMSLSFPVKGNWRVVDSGVECPDCRLGTILASISNLPRSGSRPLQLGATALTVDAFYCSNTECARLFHHVPGFCNSDHSIIVFYRKVHPEPEPKTRDEVVLPRWDG